jgi:hypothetical protein
MNTPSAKTAALRAHHILCPHELLCRFAKPAVLEQRRATILQRPFDQMALKRKQELGHPQRVNAVAVGQLAL